jgi:invasion protein IalB
MGMRKVSIALICVLAAGAAALLATVFFPNHSEVSAQSPAPPKSSTAPRAPTPPQAQAPAPPQVQAPVAAPAAPAGPVRTETITYDMWTVTCRDTADGKTKKVCSASLAMQVEQQNQRVTLGAWVIGHNNEGALMSVIQTPQIDIGVLVNRGVEFKLGEGKPRKLSFAACNPRLCESSMPMDDATIKEVMADANGAASVTFWKADGNAFTINLASIKGIDKAISALR